MLILITSNSLPMTDTRQNSRLCSAIKATICQPMRFGSKGVSKGWVWYFCAVSVERGVPGGETPLWLAWIHWGRTEPDNPAKRSYYFSSSQFFQELKSFLYSLFQASATYISFLFLPTLIFFYPNWVFSLFFFFDRHMLRDSGSLPILVIPGLMYASHCWEAPLAVC